MLKRLRVKFIALNMTIAVLVLGVAFCTVCYIDYRSNLASVYATLNASLDRIQSPANELSDEPSRKEEGGGRFTDASKNDDAANAPEEPAAGTGDAASAADLPADNSFADAAPADDAFADAAPADDGSADAAPADDDSADDESFSRNGFPQIGLQPQGPETIALVAVYEVSAADIYTALTDFSTVSVSEDILDEAIEKAFYAAEDAGCLSDLGLYFAKRSTVDGIYIAYADIGAVSSWTNLARILFVVGFISLAVFLLISLFFSKWALRPVEKAWIQQQQFIADASHELKTPLTVILANNEILRSHPASSIAEQSQWVESTQSEALRMQTLVEDMLDLARPGDGDTQTQGFVSVDFSDIVEGMVLQFESVAYERKLNLESSVEAGLHLQGDPQRLERLVSTLLDNACKYAHADGAVTVTLRRNARNAQMEVVNDGEIIPAEDLEHVFDRFYRADKARADDGGARSYGLGLAIAKDIAQAHAGDITVSSAAETGTVFTVTLPLSEIRIPSEI